MAIGPVDDQAARGEPIDIGTDDLRFSVATKFRPQVIRDNEEDVRVTCRSSAERGDQRSLGKKKPAWDFHVWKRCHSALSTIEKRTLQRRISGRRYLSHVTNGVAPENIMPTRNRPTNPDLPDDFSLCLPSTATLECSIPATIVAEASLLEI